jgi:hypothetical protein
MFIAVIRVMSLNSLWTTLVAVFLVSVRVFGYGGQLSTEILPSGLEIRISDSTDSATLIHSISPLIREEWLKARGELVYFKRSQFEALGKLDDK